MHRSLATLVTLALAAPATAQTADEIFEASYTDLGPFQRVDTLLDLDAGVIDGVGLWFLEDSTDNVLRGYTSEGDGHFEVLWEIDIDGYTSGTVRKANFDGVAPDDFYYWSNLGVRSWVTEPGGALPQEYAAPLPSGQWFRDFFAADFDDDGLDDILIGYNNDARIYLNQGPGQGFVYASSSPGYQGNTSRYALGDVTGDDVPDLVITATDNGVVRMKTFPIANGAFQPGYVKVTNIFNGWPRVADLDDDGDEDVIVFNDTGEMQLFRNTGIGNFTREQVKFGGPSTHFFDINADGHLDGLCCGGGGGGPYENDDPSQFMIAIGDGTGDLLPAVAFDSIGAEILAGVADVDLDGDDDLVAGRSVLLNHTLTGQRFCDATPSSVGAPVLLDCTGSSSLGRDDLVFHATGVPGPVFGILLMARDETYVPLSNGNLCVTGTLFRQGVHSADEGGTFTIPLDVASLPLAGAGHIEPGQSHTFQLWYRDYWLSHGANLTDAQRITFTP